MYIPAVNRIDADDDVRALVAGVGSAQFVTTGADGFPDATLLPVVWRGDTVIAHIARANPQWQNLDTADKCLLIASGPEAYVSPSWYASKATHGRVVPTWNYSAVHLFGTVVVHDDPDWLRAAVRDLTEVHEGRRSKPWQVDDAPERFIDAQLRGIVGLEVTVVRVEAKAKLSQNRSEADRRGVVDGLRHENLSGAIEVASLMQAAL